jgi:hypothetical protein
VSLVDTHGAGDAFIGALVSRLVDGSSLLEATRFANAAASLFVSTPTDQKKLVTFDRVAQFLSESWGGSERGVQRSIGALTERRPEGIANTFHFRKKAIERRLPISDWMLSD